MRKSNSLAASDKPKLPCLCGQVYMSTLELGHLILFQKCPWEQGRELEKEEKGFAMNSMEPLAGTLRKTLVLLTARLNKAQDVAYFT